MSEHLPHLMEYAVQIAWDYLERTGQIYDGAFTSRFLMTTVEDMRTRPFCRLLLLERWQRFVDSNRLSRWSSAEAAEIPVRF